MGWIGTATTTGPCHLHAMSDVRYLEARCNTHTFELAIDGEILSLNNFGFGCAWLEQQHRSMHALSDLGGSMRRPDIRNYSNDANISRKAIYGKSLHSLISKSVLDKNHSQSRSGRERALSFKKRELKNTATVWFTIDCTFEINAVDNLASGDLVGISNTSALDSQAVLSFASQNSLVIGDQLLGSF